MKVEIYTLAFNEEILLPLMVKFYRDRFPGCRIVVYDNESTDNTAKMAKELGCEVFTYKTNDELSDQAFIDIKNTCWKNAKSDWVIVCDMDELLDINEQTLINEEKKGSTIINSVFCQTVNLNQGLYYPQDIDKFRCFNKKEIKEINYNIGAHVCSPTGNVVYSKGFIHVNTLNG